MVFYSTSKRLICNVKDFYPISWYFPFRKIDKEAIFIGWGRKKSGLNAIKLAKKFDKNFLLLEDGFIRSFGLGLQNSPSFSIVEDDVGIYYDATKPSKLENLLNTCNFTKELLEQAKKAMKFIKKYEISKYNNNLPLPKDFLSSNDEKRVLIITQVANDASLEFGLAKDFNTQDLIEDCIRENPDSKIYIKIHPDVLTGRKQSDFKIENLPKNCKIINQNYNPIALLKKFHKVYTKTSGMGFEALILGCECVCYGMPFYAGWGITKDKLKCERRITKRSLEEIFAASFLLYSKYFNPYTKKKSDIFDTILTLRNKRDNMLTL